MAKKELIKYLAGRKIIRVEEDPPLDLTLVFDDGTELSFSAIGDDMTYLEFGLKLKDGTFVEDIQV